MPFLQSIIGWFQDASNYFYNLYLDVFYWIIPFNAIAPFFYSLCLVFNGLAWQFQAFNYWVSNVQKILANILSWATVQSYIRSWLSGIENVIAWFSNWWSNVWNEIGDWWSTTYPVVQGWINSAKQLLQTQINSFSSWLASLQADVQELLAALPSLDEILAWFGNWWGNILSRIEAWWNEKLLGVNRLIESTLRAWFPFYDELAGLWNDIKLFFTDPLEWLYTKMDEFFERFW